jgi:hypothetical protein
VLLWRRNGALALNQREDFPVSFELPSGFKGVASYLSRYSRGDKTIQRTGKAGMVGDVTGCERLHSGSVSQLNSQPVDMALR